MTWILIVWAHSMFGFNDQTTFEKFDSQEACMISGNERLGKVEGVGDFSHMPYAFICSPGGIFVAPTSQETINDNDHHLGHDRRHLGHDRRHDSAAGAVGAGEGET